jgi:hypothetical protein
MKISASLILFAALTSSAVYAGTADYVYLPTVEYGEREIDFKFGTVMPSDGDRNTVTSLGFGYGETEYWFTELYLKREVAGMASDVTLAEWENKFQLLETGKYPIELGLITELEAPVSESGPWEAKIGPLLQTEFGKLQLNVNLLFERKYSSNGSGEQYPTEALYQWQIKYRMQPEFEYGLQGFGNMGEWDIWVGSKEEEYHRVGPAIFGKIPLGNRQAVKYNAAWLIGSGTGVEEKTLRMQIEYEF